MVTLVFKTRSFEKDADGQVWMVTGRFRTKLYDVDEHCGVSSKGRPLRITFAYYPDAPADKRIAVDDHGRIIVEKWAAR